MEQTITSGEVISAPDMCGYCCMSTGGQHEANCPLGHYAVGHRREFRNEVIQVILRLDSGA